MGLRDEMTADFASEEVDEDLFEEVTVEGRTLRAMVSDDPLMSTPGEEGGGFFTEGEKEFKFRRADNTGIKKRALVEYGGERFRIFSVVDRPSHPLILTRGRLEGS